MTIPKNTGIFVEKYFRFSFSPVLFLSDITFEYATMDFSLSLSLLYNISVPGREVTSAIMKLHKKLHMPTLEFECATSLYIVSSSFLGDPVLSPEMD
jgi:hypothetical protein